MATRQRYSRLAKVEAKKAKRSAYFYVILTLGVIVVLFFFGLPLLIYISSFVNTALDRNGGILVSDNTPPAPPRLDSIPEYTNEDEVTVRGTAEPGTTITIKFNGTTKELIANASGEFTSKFPLQKGENVVTAFATDKAGNMSMDSDRATVNQDKEDPEVEISKPQDGQVFYSSKEKQITVEGQTDAENRVEINGRVIVVSSSGAFTMPASLEEGDNTFTVKAIDRAGNETEKVVTVKYYP